MDDAGARLPEADAKVGARGRQEVVHLLVRPHRVLQVRHAAELAVPGVTEGSFLWVREGEVFKAACSKGCHADLLPTPGHKAPNCLVLDTYSQACACCSQQPR